MKNVTDSLKPSDSAAVVPVKMTADWSCPDFTITISGYYTGCFSRHRNKAAEQMAALKELTKEAIARGYTVHENTSMDTMNTHYHFFRTGPAIEPEKHNRIEESVPIEAEEVIEVKRIKNHESKNITH